MVMTYNSLVQQIQDQLERTDTVFVNNLPRMIRQASDRINADSKNVGLEQYVTGAFNVGNPVIQKPGRWRRTITFNYGVGVGNNTRTQIRLRSYEFLRTLWPDSTQTGSPQYYADYGFNNFLIAPTPDLAYPFELAYMELPEPLGPTIQTNWLTNYAPRLLLYATLLECVIYLKDPERIPEMEDQYRKSLAPLNEQDNLRMIDRATDREAD